MRRTRRLGRFALMMLTLTALSAAPLSRADSVDQELNALMMGGSGMPTPSVAWRDAIIADYINPATGGNYTPVLVPTPESFDSTSVSTGLANLQAAMAQQETLHPGQPYLIEGYSQSAVIAIQEKIALMESDRVPPDVTLLLLGSPMRPNGGLLERFADLVVPGVVGFEFDGAEPTDGGIPTIDVANQYDAFADFPQFPLNPIADLNALFGIIYAHASYGDGAIPGVPAIWPGSDPLEGPFADHYVLGSSQIVQQVTGDTTFYFVPGDLPLLGPLRSLGVPDSWLDIVQPALRVLVEAGYDRTLPFGDAVPAQLIPTIDPITFTLEFAQAVVQGANNFFGLFGFELPGYAQLQTAFDEALAWSTQEIGVPYYDAVSWINDAFNPFTTFTALEGPLGQGIQELLDVTGIQQLLIDPILGLIGPLGGLFTS